MFKIYFNDFHFELSLIWGILLFGALIALSFFLSFVLLRFTIFKRKNDKNKVQSDTVDVTGKITSKNKPVVIEKNADFAINNEDKVPADKFKFDDKSSKVESDINKTEAKFEVKKKKEKKTDYYRYYLKAASKLKKGSSVVFDDENFGLLIFDDNRNLVYFNSAVFYLLKLEKADFNLDWFLEAFGDSNGMKSSFLLGTASFEVTHRIKDKFLLFKYRLFEQQNVYYTSFLIYDVTEKEKRDEEARQFVANVSHELKTPLTTIKSYSESLLDWGLKEKTKEKIGNDISRIYEDSLRMERLVNDLSLLTCLDSRAMVPLMTELELLPLIKSVVDRCSFDAAKKDITVDIHCLADIPVVFAEKSSIERIITNLLSNAIKYTRKKGYINISLNYIYNEVYVKISDNGIGIAKENLSKIFERFYRVDNTGSVMYGGTGLGLAIAKDLAKLHEARLDVQSELNQGSSFFLFMPTADRIFRETLHSFANLNPLTSTIYKQAAKHLLDLCEDLLPERKTLTAISEEEIDLLCEHVTPLNMLDDFESDFETDDSIISAHKEEISNKDESQK